MDERTNAVAAAEAAQQADTDLLFQAYKLGPFALPHRIVMAPLTRSRARQSARKSPTTLPKRARYSCLSARIQRSCEDCIHEENGHV